MKEPIIEIKDLCFSYNNEKQVFENLNFTLRKGEKIGLVGPNGVGKSTLFHLIMGLIKPQKGIINIFGKERKKEDDFKEVRRRIGMLFQDSDDQLFCPTVEEDIAFGPLNLGISPKQIDYTVEQVCKILGLEKLKKKVTHKLSFGEKRLVALATVVAMKPECFLFDEPTTGLDEETSNKFLQYLHNYTDTYIIISHDISFLEKSVDKIYKIVNKRINIDKNYKFPDMPYLFTI